MEKIQTLIAKLKEHYNPLTLYSCIELAKSNQTLTSDQIKDLEDIVIKNDNTGLICLSLIKNIPNANITKLEDAVIQKDESGYYCYLLARDVSGINISKLEDAVIQKDKTGYICYQFAKDLFLIANVQKLQKAIIQKNYSEI